MASKTKTPAAIFYNTQVAGATESKENSIKFHATLSEDHEASSQITKYPVQSGFEVSTHAIRQNRRIALRGLFTDTLLDGTDQIQYSASGKNSKEMFEVLESLVLSKIECKVVSNLGVYYPVVFTSFKTSQGVGTMDSMEFVIQGEELQVVTDTSKVAPKPLVFTKVSEKDMYALADEMDKAGLPFSYHANVERTKVQLGTDFSIESTDQSGKPTTTTFECVGHNNDTGVYSYKTSITGAALWASEVTGVSSIVGSANDLLSGLIGTSNCLISEGTDYLAGVAIDKVENLVDTALGPLEDGVNGFISDITSIGGSSVAQTLLGFAVDCVTNTVSESVASTIGLEANTPEELLDKSILSIKGKAKELTGFTTTEATITKISNPIKGAMSFLR